MSTEMHYKLMRHLEANPQMSQRELARELGISLGMVNYATLLGSARLDGLADALSGRFRRIGGAA
jgi:hypothetical protein